MAVINSSSFNFAESIETMLQHYMIEDVVPNMTRAVREVGRESAKKLKATSPKRPGSGKYAKGWTFTEEKGRFRVGGKVHGKSGTYQLAHLLEHGHALRGGGRSRAIEHIAPVEDWAIKEVFDRFIHYMGGD